MLRYILLLQNVQMIEILDTTDATLVGGKFEGFMKFAGTLRFGNYHGREEFAIFSGHCDRELPKWGCEQCDSTSNIFMAKTQPVLEVSGVRACDSTSNIFMAKTQPVLGVESYTW